MQANPSILSSKAALQQARAILDVNLAANRLNLAVSGSVQRNTADEGPSSVVFRGGLDASWEIDVFGANRSAVANSEAELQASIANLRDMQLSMTAEVVLAYIQLRSLQAQLDIARNSLSSQQETLQITQWRAQAGLVTSLEVEQAKTAEAQSAAQIPALLSNLGQARHSLAVLTGQNPNELEAELQAAGPIPQIDAQVGQRDPGRQSASARGCACRRGAHHGRTGRCG